MASAACRLCKSVLYFTQNRISTLGLQTAHIDHALSTLVSQRPGFIHTRGDIGLYIITGLYFHFLHLYCSSHEIKPGKFGKPCMQTRKMQAGVAPALHEFRIAADGGCPGATLFCNTEVKQICLTTKSNCIPTQYSVCGCLGNFGNTGDGFCDGSVHAQCTLAAPYQSHNVIHHYTVMSSIIGRTDPNVVVMWAVSALRQS